jgi:hypothetical protein
MTVSLPAPTWDPSARLTPVIPDLASTRCDLHRIGYSVLAVARHEATGRFGLRGSVGGFGTPDFAADGGAANRVVRVDGGEIVDSTNDGERRATLTTLRAAGEFIGVVPSFEPSAEHDSPELGDIDRELDLDPARVTFFAEWFAFGWTVLEALRADHADNAEADASLTQLWPGHFDPAVEIGSSDLGQRATYGASPGDGGHDEPYLYVGAWGDVDRSESYWNETAFNGASLSYADLVASSTPFSDAYEFLRHGSRLLR